MLFYLDNWQSAAPNGARRRPRRHRRAAAARRPSRRDRASADRQPAQPQPRRTGAAGPERELRARADGAAHARRRRRLHAEGRRRKWRARSPAGRSHSPRQGGGFRFEPRMHDDGEKIVLGPPHQGRRRRDGRRAGARHPRRASVDGALHRDEAGAPVRRRRAAAGARRSRGGAVPRHHGDIREVVRTIVDLAGVLRADAYRAKVKTPLEFVVSARARNGGRGRNATAARAGAARARHAALSVPAADRLRRPADAWVNTGALLTRMNFARRADRGPAARRRGVRASTGRRRWRRDALVDEVLARRSRRRRRARPSARRDPPPQAMALLLGSPEFQRR